MVICTSHTPTQRQIRTGKTALRWQLWQTGKTHSSGPVTALAIYLSCTCFGPGANMDFPGDTINKRYSDALTAFLKRDAVKDSIKQYAELLLGSHSTRKGATNAGAQGGLVAGVLMAVLLRGQWDIGATLKRYFKENISGDALVSRIVAGLNIYCSTSKEVKELSIIIIT